MIYRFTEVLNDLVNYFLLGDILLLEDWKQANHLSDDLAMEFTTNESGDRIFAEGIVIPMTGIENYPYTILFNLSGDRPELCKERNRLQLRKSGYSLKVDHNMLMLFTWPILEQFTPEKVKDLISYYRVHKKPMIELANGWYRLMLKDYPDVMDIGQMCEALGVSTKTGYKLLKDGKIEYLKIGRAYRIPKAHILRYLKITCSTFAE